MEAFSEIMTASLPEKTKTYTPIAHMDIISQIRNEIKLAGYKITDEQYKSSNDGKVALGMFKLNYKADDDISLTCNFVNSYNKQYAFRFNLGARFNSTDAGLIISNDNFSKYKRVHKGKANILAHGNISEVLKDSDDYWSTLISHKNFLKSVVLSPSDRHIITGKLFFDLEVLNTLQMNVIQVAMKDYIKSFEKERGTFVNITAFDFYNLLSLSLKESRPATWMDDQIALHKTFDELLVFPPIFDSKADASDLEESGGLFEKSEGKSPEDIIFEKTICDPSDPSKELKDVEFTDLVEDEIISTNESLDELHAEIDGCVYADESESKLANEDLKVEDLTMPKDTISDFGTSKDAM